MGKTEVHKMVTKAAVRKVLLESLLVDTSYQREVKGGHTKIVDNFDEDALGILLVAEREDGTLWIVDGLQRVTALKKLGHSSVLARVFSSDGPEHEAHVFKRVNLDRTKLSPLELFRSLLAAQDADAWALKESVEAQQFRISTDSRSPMSLRCVSMLQRVQCVHGLDALAFSLECCRDAWPGERVTLWSDIIYGLAWFYSEAGASVDMAVMKAKMATTTPQKIMYAARRQSLSNSPRSEVLELLKKLYKKRVNGVVKRDLAE